ncbi:unnamed protein product [Gadus morhua 'NCC']
MDAVVHPGCSEQVLLDWNPWPRASPPCFSVRSEHESTENKVKVVTLWCWLRDRSPSSLIAMTTFPLPE